MSTLAAAVWASMVVAGGPPQSGVVTLTQLLRSGVHFGHQRRWLNPKMRSFVFTERNGSCLIDLRQTLRHIDRAFEYIRHTVADGGEILFVGTKEQAQEIIAEQAQRVGMPYVNHRWQGGMLTNFRTMSRRIQRLHDLDKIGPGTLPAGHTKKETQQLVRERSKLDQTLGGLRAFHELPAAVWVVDTVKEHIAVDEARRLGIPVVAVLDTNCDPDKVDYPIAGNDDALRSTALLTRLVADAVASGLMDRSRIPGAHTYLDKGELERPALASARHDRAYVESSAN